MIRESIVITTDLKNKPHVVPMGINFNGGKLFISPFIPSKTYLNLKENPYAVINFTDDVNIFVDALLGKKNFKIQATKKIKSFYLKNALSYIEVEVTKFIENKIRPKFECKILNVKKSKTRKIDDEFAKLMGAKDIKDLKSLIENQISSQKDFFLILAEHLCLHFRQIYFHQQLLNNQKLLDLL